MCAIRTKSASAIVASPNAFITNAFFAAAIARRPLVPEADQEVRREADESPADEQQQQVAALDEQQHREDEERHVREVAPLLVVAVHVADRVEDDQRADAADDQHHHRAERVDEERAARPRSCRSAARSRRSSQRAGVPGLRSAATRNAQIAPAKATDDARRRDPAGDARAGSACPRAGSRSSRRAGRAGRARRRRSTQPPHPCSSVSVSTSSASRRRCSATTRPSPTHDLGGGDSHHGEREDLAVAVADVARERDQGEVRPVQHDLEREQDDQDVAPDQHAERARPEEERGDPEVPGDAGSAIASTSSRSDSDSDSARCMCAEAVAVARRVCAPRMTPPTAATSSTIDVISKASRWSVRKSRPIQAGEPKCAPTLESCPSEPPALRPIDDDDLGQQRPGREHRRRASARPARPPTAPRAAARRTRSRTGT